MSTVIVAAMESGAGRETMGVSCHDSVCWCKRRFSVLDARIDGGAEGTSGVPMRFTASMESLEMESDKEEDEDKGGEEDNVEAEDDATPSRHTVVFRGVLVVESESIFLVFFSSPFFFFFFTAEAFFGFSEAIDTSVVMEGEGRRRWDGCALLSFFFLWKSTL